MTLGLYIGIVTAIIDAQFDGFIFPDGFDSDVDICFVRRMTPEEAAEELLADYMGE